MSALYKDSNGQLLFRKSFCAYMDILGFSEKIASNDLRFFSDYLTTLDKELKYIDLIHDLSGKKGLKNFELKIFTDNFVFGHPWYDNSGESELGNIFDILAHIQLTFAKSNIFVRGAVSMSNLYMDENIVLGPAIIESYKLESEKALYPRVILSKDVVEIVKKHVKYYAIQNSSPQSKEYLIDVDGHYFLNYLVTIIEENENPEHIVTELTQHKDAVVKNLVMFKENFKLFNKFSWTANYHNYFCDNFIAAEFPDININRIKISDELYLKTIKRIV